MPDKKTPDMDQEIINNLDLAMSLDMFLNPDEYEALSGLEDAEIDLNSENTKNEEDEL